MSYQYLEDGSYYFYVAAYYFIDMEEVYGVLKKKKREKIPFPFTGIPLNEVEIHSNCSTRYFSDSEPEVIAERSSR
jgi:hypothetical protein